MGNTIWELDFYSRPILDENNKKVWEVLICESLTDLERSPDDIFRYSQYCSSKTVNSLWLREAIEKATDQAGVTPKKIRFFRRQMNNMITKACEEAGIAAVPSRRTYTLNHWLKQRMKDVYPQEAGYDGQTANASVQYPLLNAIPLPDAVRGDRGDKWAFVNLQASDFAEMSEWEIGFKEAFPLSLLNLNPKTKIPGLIIFSPRSTPLAAWLSGLEMGFLHLEHEPRPRICLDTALSDSWILINLTNPSTLAEAKEFESAKQKAQGVHFLAIQSSPESQSFAGFWLLLA